MHCPIRRLVLLAAAVAATSTPVLAVDPHAVSNMTGLCAIGVGNYGPNLPQVGATAVTPITASDGETGFQAQCGVEDTFFFGAGLSQYFTAHAAATGMCVGKVGVLRGFGIAQAETYPASYDPPVYSAATNILSAYASVGGGGFFADVIVPPPTSTAPNAGDATQLILTPVLDIDCGHDSNSFMESEISISFWAPDSYTDISIDFVDPGFIFSTGVRRSGACPGGSLPPFPMTVPGLTVGQPIVMRVIFGVFPHMQLLASQGQFGSYIAEISALNTATALLSTTDGDPVTGASGHTYTTVDPVPDLTIPTTTTTTAPTPTTTTTLPSCGGTCGNGTVDAACGEACDCPPTADPVVAAYGCTGAAIVPAQPSCVVCRGCQLLSFCPPSTTTSTTTTFPGESTTTSTTTVGATTTTTTTVPALPCTGFSGLARARCQLAAALAQPLCGSEVVPSAVYRAVRAKLEGANSALGSALTATGRKEKKLQHRAVNDLVAAGARAAKAAKAKNPRRQVSAPCAATLGRLTGELAKELANP